MRAASPVIRPFRPADGPALLAINHAGAPGVSLLAPGDLAELTAAAAYAVVAEVDGRVSAYVVALGPEADYDGEEFGWFRSRLGDGFVYIDQVAVAEEWRGRGLGGALYDALEAWAHARGAERIVCEANLRPRNAPSLRFHARRGFARVGTLETGDGRLVALLSKDLARPTGSDDAVQRAAARS